MKLSTAKQLAILPGARMLEGRSGVVFSQCTVAVNWQVVGRIRIALSCATG